MIYDEKIYFPPIVVGQKNLRLLDPPSYNYLRESAHLRSDNDVSNRELKQAKSSLFQILSFFSYFFTFGYVEGKNLIYVGLTVTFIIFLTKNIFLLFNHWHQSKFLEKIILELSDKLFKDYLKRDYIFFLQMNTAQLMANVKSEIPSFVEYVNRMMVFFGEIIIFLGIAILLFHVDFFGTSIILLFIGVFIFLIYTFKIFIFLQNFSRNRK